MRRTTTIALALLLLLIGLTTMVDAEQVSQTSVTVSEDGAKKMMYSGTHLKKEAPASATEISRYSGMELLTIYDPGVLPVASSRDADGVNAHHVFQTPDGGGWIITQPVGWGAPPTYLGNDGETIIDLMPPTSPPAGGQPVASGSQLVSHLDGGVSYQWCRSCAVWKDTCVDLQIYDCYGSCSGDCHKCVTWVC